MINLEMLSELKKPILLRFNLAFHIFQTVLIVPLPFLIFLILLLQL
jgi:hypothetical protein